MKKSEIIEKFGKILIEQVRDQSIKNSFKILDSSVKSPALIVLAKEADIFSASQKDIIKKIISESVDEALHNFLWLFEQEEEWLRIKIEKCKEEIDLFEISDGLCGDYVNFIDEYSKYKRGTD